LILDFFENLIRRRALYIVLLDHLTTSEMELACELFAPDAIKAVQQKVTKGKCGQAHTFHRVKAERHKKYLRLL
jgi:hypothetical protein